MQSAPLVSIVVPAYNQGRFIAETIDSLLAQEYAHREIIVLDDGSTDETADVVREYGDRVRGVRHANMGENPTVNCGLELARGEVVAIVNADDPLLPGAIEAGVASLVADSTALAAYPDWVEIDPAGTVIRTVLLPDYDLRGMLLGFNVAVGPGVFLRRAALERVGGRNPGLRYTGDLDYWFRVAMLGGLRRIPRVLATHRVHPQAASSSAQGEAMAAEVLRLVEVAVRSPDLPRDLKPYRSYLLRRAHEVAAHYCGADSVARRRHVRLARWYRRRAGLRAALSGLPRPGPGVVPEVVVAAHPVHYRTLFP